MAWPFRGAPSPAADPPRRRRTDRPVTLARVRQWYERPTSFTNLLPWMEYDPATGCFLLEDGVSWAALFELTPRACEARPAAYLEDLHGQLQALLTEVFPEEEAGWWVLQLYLQDEPSLLSLLRQVRQYPATAVRASAYTRAWLAQCEAHFERLGRPGGAFVDAAVTGLPWRGHLRRVRAVLYRRLGGTRASALGMSGPAAVNAVSDKFTSTLAAAGIPAQRGAGRDLYDWLLTWFNPCPALADGDRHRLLEDFAPYPGDTDLPYGADLSESLVLGMPASDPDSGVWWFDGQPHRVVTVRRLRTVPTPGHLTAERRRGDYTCAWFDRLPEGVILVLTVTFRPQSQVQSHLARIQQAAVGDGPEAVLARQETEYARLQIAQGNKLYPVDLACYVHGADLHDLADKTTRLQALLVAQGLQPLVGESDLLALDSYVRYLPMNFEPQFDRERRRSRLQFTRHLAALLPLYGRARGTGQPGLVFWNRGGEPLTVDPLRDRQANAHLLLVGPTGTGKSALLVYALLQLMALYRPWVVIVETGGSFKLLGEHFAAHGLSVHSVTLKPGVDVSLPPFADALKLVAGALSPAATDWEATGDDTDPTDDPDADDDADTGRDLLGEMEIAARLMMIGGDPREDSRLTRADRLLIREAIVQAARAVQAVGRPQVLISDVVAALRAAPTERRARAQEMADGLALFCSGLAGHFFNRPGQPWPAADVTILDMGILAREGYEDQLTVAYLGLMNALSERVERRQYERRPTLVLTDEGHLITTNPLLAPYVVKITKMWRKWGCWLWLATQSLEDFPNAAKRMLNMMEWWLCLAPPKEEIEQIARFRELSAEEQALLASARKVGGQYTEGVILGKNLTALFRQIPPPLALTLAMTEQSEKAARRAIMREQGCSELQAAYVMAERLAAAPDARQP